MESYPIRAKASCVIRVMACGATIEAYLIGYSGGIVGDCNIWAEEVDNSPHCDDIFFNAGYPQDKPGFYVWEGEIEPVYGDAPNFYGDWRPATKKDMAALIIEDKEPKK